MPLIQEKYHFSVLPPDLLSDLSTICFENSQSESFENSQVVFIPCQPLLHGLAEPGSSFQSEVGASSTCLLRVQAGAHGIRKHCRQHCLSKGPRGGPRRQ